MSKKIPNTQTPDCIDKIAKQTWLYELADGDILPNNELNDFVVPPTHAAHLINTFLISEGSARQNLATFCQTYMDPEAEALIANNLSKNSIDKTEYPQTAEIEERCIKMISHLWNAPSSDYIGTSTIGSSEACQLAGMAMKVRWEEYAKKKELPFGGCTGKSPNIIISSAYQVCWEKFSTFWDVELREIPLTEDALTLDIPAAINAIDEYTIGIVPIFGVTYTGSYDNVEALDSALEIYNETAEYKIPIHVDGASGALFAPFTNKDLKWDFRLKNVVSISTSGHKYGLVYPGVGWVVWKDKKYVPQKLSFDVSYLGGSLTTLGVNFSRSASQIIAQYYVFFRYGFSGIREIHLKTSKIAQKICNSLKEHDLFDFYNEGNELPIICYKLKDTANVGWSLYDLSDRLMMKGWQVPTYPLPSQEEENIVQRIVCRSDFSHSMADQLANAFEEAINVLNNAHVTVHANQTDPYGFTH